MNSAAIVNDDEPYLACRAQAASCVCTSQAGHERDGLPHLCPCGGQWHGSYDDVTFDPVALPRLPA